jgi:hypothetical protein
MMLVPALTPSALALIAIVGLGFVVEAALGFGATVVVVGLGTLLMPVGPLLAAFLPLNLVLSSWVVATDRRHVAWRVLLRGLLPRMALGLPIGFLLVRVVPERATLRAFGAFVIALAVREILLQRRAAGAAPAPLRPRVRDLSLVAAGVLHGAFGVGGPLAVFVAQRDLPEKSTFRSTLSALWLCLNTVMVAALAARGSYDRATATTIALLVPATAVGITGGLALHHALPERTFRRAVLAMLLVVGVFRFLVA